MIIFRNPASVAPPIGRYSHSVEIPANARTLIVSGQVGMAPDGSLPPDYFEQLRNALRNVQSNVEAAGMTTRDIVKCTLLASLSRRMQSSAHLQLLRPPGSLRGSRFSP